MSRLIVLSFFITVACSHNPGSPGVETRRDGVQIRPDWRAAFEKESASGCLVLERDSDGFQQAFNLKRAMRRLTPASTFKIPNSLIALETKAIRDQEEVFVWDGKPRQIKSWEQDHTLRSAFRYSVVPVYQEIARRVGEERMAQYVAAFDYGNKDIGGGIDRFWLDGNLKVSAFDQIAFLRKLQHDALPASKINMHKIKNIMIREQGEGYVIRGKTGWALRDENSVGWWVGWIETKSDIWYFALNMELKEMKNAPKRLRIVRSIAESEEILPSIESESKR